MNHFKRKRTGIVLAGIAVLGVMLVASILFNTPVARIYGQEEGTPVYLPVIGNPDVPPAPTEDSGDPAGRLRRRTPTPVATATLLPPQTATPVPTSPPGATQTAAPTMDHGDHESMFWHAPGAHGLTTVHEHGDAPPQWVVDFNGGQPMFEHVAGTPNENGHDNNVWWKHTSFKGWAGRFGEVDWYGIFHMDFNPSGHPSRFHSYQIWLRDATGAVSHMHGWLDFGVGNSTGPQVVLTCGENFEPRPVMALNRLPSECPGGVSTPIFESWYSAPSGGEIGGSTGGWKPDFGFNIASNYYAGGDPADPSSWVALGGVRNTTRRLEFAWYATRSNLRGDFWTDQWARVMTGPTDPRCGQPVVVGERTYTRVCLMQHIAPTLTTIQFPGNAVQRTFTGSGLQLPN